MPGLKPGFISALLSFIYSRAVHNKKWVYKLDPTILKKEQTWSALGDSGEEELPFDKKKKTLQLEHSEKQTPANTGWCREKKCDRALKFLIIQVS